MSDDRAYLRLLAVSAVVLAVVVLGAGVRWSSIAFPTPLAPPVARITSVSWSVDGCSVPSGTGGGVVVAAGSTVPVTTTLTNENPTSACTLTSVRVLPANFTVETDPLPLVLGPSGSSGIEVGLAVPTGWYVGPVSLVLGGAPSP